MARKAASGTGTIRKKTVTRNGKEYTYWEARYSAGTDPGTGKQIQRSISGKTQKEVAQKLKAATAALDAGTYTAPSKMTVGEWLDIWLAEYLGSVKPRTLDSYKATANNHIRPALGAVKLEVLATHQIQTLYNSLQRQETPLSPKSIKNLHGVLHKALEQAVDLAYIRFNPAGACKLPRVERTEIKPLDDVAISAFMVASHGHKYENLYLTTLFTGMREGEVLGLTWDCVDFKGSTLTINKQLQKERGGAGEYHLVSPKNGKARHITLAPSVLAILKAQRARQAEWKLKLGEMWEQSGLVFTDETGHHLSAQTVYLHFKKLAAEAGYPDARFHDLRHSYAVAALQSGIDVKTVQETLGHHTAAFTLDVYGHVTERMKQESANRMEAFIKHVSDL
ncbi:MAG: tyrosine-type recombinase/integrase [Angelakisella sp.]